MRLLASCAATVGAFALISTGALAQSAQGTVNVTATVSASCTINTSTSAGLLDTADFTNSGSSSLKTSAYTLASSKATGDCNTPTHIALTSANNGAFLSGATSAGTTANGYQNCFDYQASATFGGGSSATLSTACTSSFGPVSTAVNSGTATTGPAHGAVGLTITPQTNGAKYQAGTYSDVLTVTLTAD